MQYILCIRAIIYKYYLYDETQTHQSIADVVFICSIMLHLNRWKMFESENMYFITDNVAKSMKQCISL